MSDTITYPYTLNFRLTSPLTKVMPSDIAKNFPEYNSASALRGDRVYFGGVVDIVAPVKSNSFRAEIRVESALAPYLTVYAVDNVPVRFPHPLGYCDGDYVGHAPGLYPDLLRKTACVYINQGVAQQLYFELNIPKRFAAGKYPVTVTVTPRQDRLDKAAPVSETLEIEVLAATIPEQEFTYTRWFHYDSLAAYYNVPVFSKRHWEIVENFIKMAVKNGMNALLTPIFTPPLDTEVGGERLTVQLLDISLDKGEYTFGFDKLKRFCKMAKRCGIKELEIAHLFTQWGAEHAPKVMATVDGEYKKLFGWETAATSAEYVGFLRAMLPQLKQKLDEFGYRDHYFFHISDEPSEKHLENYKAARDSVIDLICDHPVRDALSHYEFYEKGIVSHPIPGVNTADEFAEHNVPDLWTYYACNPVHTYTNDFIAMNAHRTRVIGAQMYRAGIVGFLHWGFNYYFNRLSRELINPYLTNDGVGTWPAGDPFSVYPANDGTAIPSLRSALFEQALFDMRAMRLAEQVSGREAVMNAIDRYGKLDFKHYPKTPDYLIGLREEINRLAVKHK